MRRPAIRLTVTALTALLLAACSSSADDWSSVALDGTRDWVPRRGAVQEPPASDTDVAKEFSDWVKTFASDLEFSGEYSESSTSQADAVLKSAAAYPVAGSKVPGSLNAAAKHLSAAQTALDKRQYSKGGQLLTKASVVFKPVGSQVVNDWKIVEQQTGIRLTDRDGIFPVYSSKESTEVLEWVDGDTVRTEMGVVRLIGVDTPEMSDTCSKAKDAKKYAELLAPEGMAISLLHPYNVNDMDKYGRLLRYVELDDETDIGYSMLLSTLAMARFDSLDGYQWHPRERKYHEASSEPDRRLVCNWASAEAFARSNDQGDSDDKDERGRMQFRTALVDALESVVLLRGQVSSAKKWHTAQDKWDREARAGGGSTGGGGSLNVPGWLCPTRWC